MTRIPTKHTCSKSCSGKLKSRLKTKPTIQKESKRKFHQPIYWPYIPKTKIPWNKGKSNPYAANNGRKGAEKMRQLALGRKRKYLPNGKWTWEYSK